MMCSLLEQSSYNLDYNFHELLFHSSIDVLYNKVDIQKGNEIVFITY